MADRAFLGKLCSTHATKKHVLRVIKTAGGTSHAFIINATGGFNKETRMFLVGFFKSEYLIHIVRYYKRKSVFTRVFYNGGRFWGHFTVTNQLWFVTKWV
jgi:hypothetical protein